MNETNGSLRDRVSRIEGGYEHLATKADIAETKAEIANVKSELKADVENVRAELANVKAELKSDIGEANAKIDRLAAEVARLETRLLLRFGSIAVAAVAAAVGFSQLLG